MLAASAQRAIFFVFIRTRKCKRELATIFEMVGSATSNDSSKTVRGEGEELLLPRVA
jgi:hypothetical protein